MFLIRKVAKITIFSISKNLTKCLRKCVRNWTNIYKIPLWMHCRKDNKNKCKQTQKLCQKPSPKGEPRTWFSHPSAAKNYVLPACQHLFGHFINLMIFLTFCDHLEIAVLPAWELTFKQMCSHLLDFLVTSNASGLAFGPAGLQDPAHTAPRPS